MRRKIVSLLLVSVFWAWGMALPVLAEENSAATRTPPVKEERVKIKERRDANIRKFFANMARRLENTITKIIILIALLVAVLAVAWFMFFRPEQADGPVDNLSTSDEVAAIEEDLNQSDLPDISEDLKAMEGELAP